VIRFLFWLNLGAAVINVTIALTMGSPLLFFVGGLSGIAAVLLWRRR
jgi:hypothetical protein